MARLHRLSPHFHADEFREHTGRAAPNNYLMWMRELCVAHLEPLRREYGAVTIVSGWRSPDYNQSVGGAPQSYHKGTVGRKGAACDLRCSRGRPADWYAFLDARGVPGLGLYASWVHADNRKGKARW